MRGDARIGKRRNDVGCVVHDVARYGGYRLQIPGRQASCDDLPVMRPVGADLAQERERVGQPAGQQALEVGRSVGYKCLVRAPNTSKAGARAAPADLQVQYPGQQRIDAGGQRIPEAANDPAKTSRPIQTPNKSADTAWAASQASEKPADTAGRAGQTTNKRATARATKESSEKASGWGSASRAATATTDRVRRSLLRVGELGADVGARAGVHQADELGMKRLGLGAEQLKFPAKVAEQRRDRRRYLIGGRRHYARRRARNTRRGLGQRRANTCQVLGRALNQVRCGNDKRHAHS